MSSEILDVFESIDFFNGARRKELLEELREGIIEGTAVTTITGEEGTGKTILCRMVEKELPEDIVCLYFPNTLESFEDVVLAIARKIGWQTTEEQITIKLLVDEIVASLWESKRRLVIIYDQAEKMYLAKLERVRKMLDQANNEKNTIQLVLSGRMGLLDNIQQLQICDFGDVEEKNISLLPYDLDQIEAYISHCCKHSFLKGKKNIFTPQVIRRIHSLSQGNLKLVNSLVGMVMEVGVSEGSYLAYLDDIAQKNEPPVLSHTERLGALIKNQDRKILVAGGVLACVLFLILVFSGGDDAENVAKEDDRKTVTEQKLSTNGDEGGRSAVTPPRKIQQKGKKENNPENIPRKDHKNNTNPRDPVSSTKEPKKTEVKKPQKPVESSKAEEQRNGPVGQEVRNESKIALSPLTVEGKKDESVKKEKLDRDTKTETAPDVGAQEPAARPGDTTVDAIEGDEEKVTATPSDPVPGSLSQPVADGTGEIPEKLEQTEVLASTDTSDREINPPPVESGQNGDLSVEPGGESQSVVILAEMKKRAPVVADESDDAKRIMKIAPVKFKQTVPVDTNGTDRETVVSNEDLYSQRLAAGSIWPDIPDKSQHTVQLMALTGTQAIDNLRKQLAGPEYSDIADDIYILQDASEKVYVFYGQFPDVSSARQARNTLPLFLRKHDPYPLSIKEALKKTGYQE